MNRRAYVPLVLIGHMSACQDLCVRSTPDLSDLAAALRPGLRSSEYNGISYLQDDMRPVAGLMEGCLGERFSSAHIATDDDRYDADDIDAIRLIRAYPVSGLIGTRLHCAGVAELGARIEGLLSERCPGWDWRTEDDGARSGRLRKYGIVHETLSAPPDETTGQPMEVEFAAQVVLLGGKPTGGGAQWWDDWIGRGGDYDAIDIDVPLEVVVETATYSNVVCGVDAPFYL